jgi:GTP-binding protein
LQLRFVRSAIDVADLPPTPAELAVVGRSNVGKSSLINALANHRGLAKVSNTPGRTQLLNLFELPGGGTFMDLPGYGYSSVPQRARAGWPAMIEGYLLGRENLVSVLVLVDGKIGPTKLDVETLGWLRDHGLACQVVATKHDQVGPSKLVKRKRDLAAGCAVSESGVMWVSSAKGTGIDQLRALVRSLID